MKPATHRQDLALSPTRSDGRPAGDAGTTPRRTPIRFCLALLAACGWLLGPDLAVAAEPHLQPRLSPLQGAASAAAVQAEISKATPEALRLLIWEGHAPDAWVQKFEKQVESRHGRSVKLMIAYVKGGEEFYDAIRDRAADVVMMTHHAYKDDRFRYIENGLLLPINLANIPNFKHVISDPRIEEYQLSAGQVYAVPVSQGPYGLAYNPALLQSEPQSWSIFWDPRFKGQYVLGANEYIYNVNITALALGYSREQIGDYEVLNNPEFKKKLRALVVNAHSFWIGVDKPENLAGRPLAVSWGDSLGPLKARGEHWKMAEPAEGTICWVDNYALTWALQGRPFLRTVAEEYINELLTTDYQVAHILRHMSLTPVVTNIGDRLTPEETSRLKLGVPHFFKNNRILQRTYSHRDRNGMKLLWDEATKGIALEERAK
jgi:spermidine/putrescine-binding protein